MLNTNGESSTTKEKDKKLMMLKFTYEQVLATQAEQVILIDGTTIAIDEIIDINSEIYQLMMYN